jgi:hypothetical protein
VSLWAAVALCVCASAESHRAALITSLKVDVLQEKIEVRIEADRVLSMQTIVLTHPDRIVLEVAGALFKVKKPEIHINAGLVKSVRVGLLQADPPITRIVVDTSTPLPYSFRIEGNSAFLDVALKPAPATPAATADKPPAPPHVTYDRGLLTIVADNASLAEILNAVHSRTGGMTEFPAAAANERATVKLGPAPLATVLAALLLGSPFDYVIVGSADDPGGTQIVLTERGLQPEPQPQRPTEAIASLQDAPIPNGAGEAPAPEDNGSAQPGEGTQFMINQPSVAMPVGRNVSGSESDEPSFDTLQAPPQQARPSREGPRVPPPGKGRGTPQ